MKILSRLLRPWADVQQEDTHALIANDSDVVLMALVTPARNVYVLAEPGRVGRRVGPAAGAAAGKGAQKGRQARAKVAAGARGLPMMSGFTCFSIAALQLLWLKKYPFLRGATPEVCTLGCPMLAFSLNFSRIAYPILLPPMLRSEDILLVAERWCTSSEHCGEPGAVAKGSCRPGGPQRGQRLPSSACGRPPARQQPVGELFDAEVREGVGP